MQTKQVPIEAAITRLRDRAAHREAEAHADKLEAERLLRLARSSTDLRAPAQQARATSAKTEARKSIPLAQRVTDALTGPVAPMSTQTLASYLEIDERKLTPVLKSLRDDARAFDVSPVGARAPLWLGVIGDDAATPELYALIYRLLQIRPWAFSELMQVTGARRGRVSGAIVELQKGHGPAGYELVNAGTETAYRHHLVPKRARR
jgi:hypothetical protein